MLNPFFKKLLFALVAIALVAFFCSCSSTKKIKSSHNSSSDSAAVSVKNNSAKVETVTFGEENTDSSSTIITEVEVKFDTTEKENDYEAAPPKKTYNYEVDDYVIVSETPVASVKVKRTGKTQSSTQKKEEKKQVAATDSKDSTAVQVKKQQTTNQQQQTKKKFSLLQVSLIAGLFLAACYGFYKIKPFLPVLFKRRKDEETG
jgi:FtsZ-interacting cell division protein ZipA